MRPGQAGGGKRGPAPLSAEVPGGTEAEYLHRTCHRKLHTLFTDKELGAEFATSEAVRRHPEMQKFITWVRRQPPEVVVRHRKPRDKK